MVCFEKNELENFNIEELRKILDILIKNEKFEGASIIRDIIEQRKKDFGIGQSNGNNAEIL